MPAGKGTYGTKKGRPPKMPRQGKGSKPNPFSAGASTTKKKKNGRSKLDANKDGKISKEDFAILRKNKKKKG